MELQEKTGSAGGNWREERQILRRKNKGGMNKSGTSCVNTSLNREWTTAGEESSVVSATCISFGGGRNIDSPLVISVSFPLGPKGSVSATLKAIKSALFESR